MASRPYVVYPQLFFQVISPTSVPLVFYVTTSPTCFCIFKCVQLMPTFIFAPLILFKYYLFRETLNYPKSISINSFPLPLSSFIVFIVLQFSSIAQLCLTPCDPIDCSAPGFPVLHYLLELAQTHVHWVSDAIQLSHPLLSPSLPVFNLSQHQGLFQWVSSSHQVAKVLELQL